MENEVHATVELLRKRVAELENELKMRDDVMRAVVEGHPDGVAVADLTGKLTFNSEAARILGDSKSEAEQSEWSDAYGLFKTDKQTPYPVAELPLSRAFGGEHSRDVMVFSRTPMSPEGVWLSVSARPLHKLDGSISGAIAVFRDVTDKKALEDDLAARNSELAESEQEKTQLIERLRAAVEELQTPVLELWEDVLALPVVGVVDSQRSAEMTERLLAETARSQARFVIVDLTGVELVDTATADRLLKLVQSVELLGARCFITGIQPAVAQTIVELGVEFGKLKALRNLKHALKLSMTLAAQDDV